MRLFLPQNVGIDEAMTPPFLTDREDDTRLTLLRETTQFVKEGRQRLPTPEKTAIMQLSTSFEKRRLGKQQQILSEMTQRCREQEVTDLSSKISAKCDLKSPGRGFINNPARDVPFYSTTTNPHRGSKQRLSEASLDNGGLEAGNISPGGDKRVNAEKAYKFFPARRIMRQQTKFGAVVSPNLPKATTVGGTKGRIPNAYLDTSRSPRYIGHIKHSSDIESPRRFPKHINHGHFVPAKADPLAPLVLPRLSLVDTGYQDRIESYITSNQIMSIPRAKTFIDTHSISGRSYHSLLNLSGQTHRALNTGKSGLKSDRSEHGLMNIPFQHDNDHHSLESVGRGFGPSVDNLIN